MLGDIIASKNIKELICDPSLAVQLIDTKTVKMAHAQGSLNLVFDIVDYPGHRCGDCIIILIVDFEFNFQCFGL